VDRHDLDRSHANNDKTKQSTPTSTDAAPTGPSRGSTSLSAASLWEHHQKILWAEARREGPGSSFGISSPASAAASRCWTSSPPLAWGGKKLRSWVLGRGATALPSDTRLHGLCRREVGCGGGFPLFFLLPFLRISLVRRISPWGRLGQRAKGSL